MRYAWVGPIDQRRARGALTRFGEGALRAWDRRSVRWVDRFAANSTSVQRRIEQFYGRAAVVIPPPVDTDLFTPGERAERGGFALAVSRMVPYKRLDLAIRAAHQASCPLVVAGAGPQESALRALAAELSADVSFIIDPSDHDLLSLYRGAGVVVFPAEEDFGIVPVEAQACGTPVVALGRGGTLDSVLHGTTGFLVDEQSASAFAAGIEAMMDSPPDAGACRRNAERFSQQQFRSRFLDWVIDSAAAEGVHLEDPRTTRTA
jgi:glycosyltransferase involved in cell wall biosynthesis